MADEPYLPDDDAAITRALRIAELKAELAMLTGEPISQHLAEDADDDDSDRMIEDLEAIESGPEMPLYDILQQRRNFTPVPLARLTHPIDLSENLWLLLYALASIRVFIHDTNHLSDQELYAVLENKVLRNATTVLPEGSGWNCRFSICEITDENDMHQSCYLRYYADEATRSMFADDDSDTPLPPKEDPPYDRDDYLPTL